MPTLDDAAVQARLADMLVRCGIERGVLGRIDADNVARILLPIVRETADQREAETWDSAADELELSGLPPTHWAVVGFRAKAAALRGLDGTQPPP
jgi:hypothetical protein